MSLASKPCGDNRRLPSSVRHDRNTEQDEGRAKRQRLRRVAGRLGHEMGDGDAASRDGKTRA